MGVIELIWLAKLGNKPQVYKDVVLEMLGAQFANKSIEIVLYWIATVSGIAMIAILMIITKTKGWYSEREIEWKESQVAISSMLAFVVGTYILWGGINANVILLLITACISCHLSKTNTIDILCFQITILYAVIGLYRLFVWMGGATSFNSTLAGILAFGICNFILLTKNNCIIKFQLAFQLFVPFSLLIFLVDRYKKDDSITVIKPEKSVYYLIVLLIVIALVSALLKIKTCWNMGVFSESISIFTTITIMAVNRFSGSGFIMTTDTHHPAENTIAYNEIINLGRKVFTEYDPVSGLYSFVQGLFLDVFGDGKYTGYHISNNVYYLVIVIISVIAIRFHLKPHLTMLLCSFILITDYCRVALILPFVLLLSSKRLVELPVYWMIMWVLFGWAYGLYYPAYGVAVIASFIPVGIYQIARLKESFIKARKGERISYILLGSTVFVVFMSLPLLIGTAKHVLDMSDGMLYVDGVTIFGQSLPEILWGI